jgi:predicted nuclease of predicted toxin-antitoxin system
MKFKLDECLDVRLATLFSDAGHDVQTVYQEKLSGASDERVYSVCLQEERILLTQDMDFSNPFRFSPLPSQGIIVLRNPSQLLAEAEYLVRMVLLRIPEERPRGRLWIVDRQQIRIWPRE